MKYQLHKAADTNPFGANFSATNSIQEGMAIIGISVEPLNVLAQQTPALNSTPSMLNNRMEFIMKMLENFVNFTLSFGLQQAQMTPNPTETFVPLSVVKKWFDNFQRKVSNDPDFWKK